MSKKCKDLHFQVSLPESKFQVPQAYTLDPYR